VSGTLDRRIPLSAVQEGKGRQGKLEYGTGYLKALRKAYTGLEKLG
jgi:hypothetical protein